MFTVLVLGMLLLREARVPPLAGMEETFINWLAANSNGEHKRAPIMLVEINDNCLVDYPWPWTPLNYAAFLDGALQFHARVAAIEPVLDWEEKNLSPDQALQQPQYEKLLHNRILQTPKLELGAALGFPEDPDVLPPLQPLPVIRNVEGAVYAVPEYTVIEAEPAEELRLSAGLGFTNVPHTEDVAQHAPLVFRYRGQIVPSFPLEALMLWNAVLPEDVQVRLGSEIRLGDKLTIPINQAGEMLVDWKVPYARAGFDDLELAVDQAEHNHASVIDPGNLKDQLVMLARTDEQSQTILLPSGRRGSAGELIAAALATAETNAFARPAGWIGKVTVLLLGIVLGWAVTVRQKLWVVPTVVGFGAGYLLLCLGVFEAMRMALPLTPMLGVTLFVGMFRLLAPQKS
jgi:hypothetical protein